jgi:hypothetical protein
MAPTGRAGQPETPADAGQIGGAGRVGCAGVRSDARGLRRDREVLAEDPESSQAPYTAPPR